MASERLANLAKQTLDNDGGINTSQRDNANLSTKEVIERDMEMGLKLNQFKVYYQSKHDTNTGKLVGAEALVRWEHRILGLLKPNEFIPIFEENGFIKKLDAYVRQRVCRDIERWKRNGYELVPISINMSRVDFDSRAIVDEIVNDVDRCNIDHSLICIEITETTNCDNQSVLVGATNLLRDAGFSIALDDFGSGYASFSTLKAVTIDSLKLDKGMLENINGKKEQYILDTCIKMGREFNAQTEAEGVETKEQLNILRELNCDSVQGFYFSQPIPSEVFEKRLVGGAF